MLEWWCSSYSDSPRRQVLCTIHSTRGIGIGHQGARARHTDILGYRRQRLLEPRTNFRHPLEVEASDEEVGASDDQRSQVGLFTFWDNGSAGV